LYKNTVWDVFTNKYINCGDKYLYTFTYVQYKQKYTEICPHTLYSIAFVAAD